MDKEQIYLKGFLGRQVYQWFQKKFKFPSEGYRAFEGKLFGGKEHELVAALFNWLAEDSPDPKPLIEWAKSQQIALLPIASIISALEIQVLMESQGNKDIRELDFYTRIALIDFGILVSLGMVKSLIVSRADKLLVKAFGYLRFLNKDTDSFWRAPLVHLIQFIHEDKELYKTKQLVRRIEQDVAKKLVEEGKADNFASENEEDKKHAFAESTLRDIKSGKTVSFKTIRKLASCLSTSKDESILLSVFFLIAHGLQYTLNSLPGDSSRIQFPLWGNYLFQLENLWNLKTESAKQRVKETLEHANLPERWKNEAVGFIGQLYTEPNTLLFKRGSTTFPFIEIKGLADFLSMPFLWGRLRFLQVFKPRLFEKNTSAVVNGIIELIDEHEEIIEQAFTSFWKQLFESLNDKPTNAEDSQNST